MNVEAHHLAIQWGVAEIARLTAELAEANKDADYYHQMWQEDGERIDEAEAERDRLRAALERIIASKPHPRWHHEMQNIAREALAGAAVTSTVTPLPAETRAATSGSERAEIEDAGRPEPLPPDEPSV